MVWKNKRIDLSSVNTADNTYKITTRVDLEDLIPSIDQLGIINSPFLFKHENGEFIIISGFRRISAAETLGRTAIHANILEPETPLVDLAKLAIADNTSQRSLNLIEQFRSIQLLSHYFPTERDLLNTATTLQLPNNQKHINNLCALSGLPDIVHQSILKGSLALPVALMMRELSIEDIDHLADMFNILQLNLNIQREILTLLSEIAKIENKSISNVVKDREIQSILSNSEMEKPLKTNNIRQYLKRKRFPAITSTEERFKHNINALKLDTHTKLIPPKFFEGTEYSITLSFKSMEELEKRREMLDNITQNPVMAEIMRKN